MEPIVMIPPLPPFFGSLAAEGKGGTVSALPSEEFGTVGEALCAEKLKSEDNEVGLM